MKISTFICATIAVVSSCVFAMANDMSPTDDAPTRVKVDTVAVAMGGDVNDVNSIKSTTEGVDTPRNKLKDANVELQKKLDFCHGERYYFETTTAALYEVEAKCIDDKAELEFKLQEALERADYAAASDVRYLETMAAALDVVEAKCNDDKAELEFKLQDALERATSMTKDLALCHEEIVSARVARKKLIREYKDIAASKMVETKKELNQCQVEAVQLELRLRFEQVLKEHAKSGVPCECGTDAGEGSVKSIGDGISDDEVDDDWPNAEDGSTESTK